ncbi:MAG: hypothetical protein HYX35_04370 [Proteobacteria bacterium]|nr:hypothetical protein [Pseudomonadota bacterium]
MHRLWGLFLGGLFLCPQSGFAADPKEEVTYIHTNEPAPSIAAEANDVNQPFFAAPSTANEAIEEIEEMKARLKKLEERVDALEKEKKEAS